MSLRRANQQAKEDLEKEVEIEAENFHIWLEDNKGLESVAAHYCAASLKSLLLGIPTGMQVAMLFDVVLGK